MKTNLRKNTVDFTIGHDVELILSHKGNRVLADNNIKDEFGADGSGGWQITEIRTVPTPCPIETVNLIRSVFLRKTKKCPNVLNYDWLAGSYRLSRPIGGHIHAGTGKMLEPSFANNVVGNYLGALSLALENRKEAMQRRKSEYGLLSDFRVQPHGFESRMFSSWATSPAVALAHLCLFKTIIYELLNNKSFSPNQRFDDKDFLNANQEKVRKLFPEIWKEVQGMVLYKKYQNYLDIFPFLINNRLTWYPKTGDVKTAWGISDGSIYEPVKPTQLWDKLAQPSVF